MRLMGRLLVAFLLIGMAGCTQTRRVTIATRPPDATLKIDGVQRGKAPITEEFVFKNAEDVHRVVASRLGFADQTVRVVRDDRRDQLMIELHPVIRRVSITVSPAPAIISIDGKPVNTEPTNFIATDLEFTVDAKNRWTTHTVSADRPGFAPAEEVLSYQDPDPNYQLLLQPMRKDLSITSNPDGALITLDGNEVGKTPLKLSAQPFQFDVSANAFAPHTLKAAKPGYDPVEQTLSWDEGKTDYHVDFVPKSKAVRIITDPPGATVTVDGTPMERSADGASTGKLSFPAVDDKGTLKSYTAQVTKKTADSEWVPAQVVIGWDEGKSDYRVTLKEILTRPVEMLSANPQRTDDGWEIVPVRATVLAMKDLTEGAQKESPVQLTQLPAGAFVDTLAVSPDGSKILFTVLSGKTKLDLRSQMIAIHADGSGGAAMLTDGKTLDLTPSFTPDGMQVVFSSNRASKRLAVWQMAADGAPGVTQLTGGDTTDLWPSIDSDPKPRLFYQALVDTRPDPRLYMTQLGTTTKTDLIQSGGGQPRVNPRGDAVVFTLVNAKTGKRDLYRMSDKGGLLENLTNTPDIDECDPAWNKDGTKIAFASDQGQTEDHPDNHDLWVIDLTRPQRPTQITTNGSWDDTPGWDPSGNALFFRSNRGGSWQIWKIAVR
ncbi:MAG: PEGA domain-containing protein [Phycisphaerales bacterium]|nr:PEGA domain-containing protein [Phycisphaerales bacterium]